MITELFEDAVLFAAVAGVVASVFSAMAWYLFQRTPARHVFASLTTLVVISTLYHAMLLVLRHHAIEAVRDGTMGLQLVRSLMYTAVAVVVVLAVYFNRTAGRNLDER